MTDKLALIGAGYVARRFARRFRAFPGEVDTGSPSGNAAEQRPRAFEISEEKRKGFSDRFPAVLATARDKDRLAGLKNQGLEPFVFDAGRPLSPELADALGEATHILVSVPPRPGATLEEDRDPAFDVLAPVLRTSKRLKWIGYLSTTGVYGDTGGAWVNETAPLNPATPRARARVAAERAWLGLAEGQPFVTHVFRLAGIYGPGRGPHMQLLAGTARRIIKPGHIFNRIHVDDICTILNASLSFPDAGPIFNVCDDEPAPASDVLEYAARALGLPVPPAVPFDEAALSQMALDFWSETKRVRNNLVKGQLKVMLQFPTYRDAWMNAKQMTEHDENGD